MSVRRRNPAAMTESTKLSLLLDRTYMEAIDLREKWAATDTVPRFILKDSCAKLVPSPRGLIEDFRAGLNRSMIEAFHVGSINSQFHADTAIDYVMLLFWEMLHRTMVAIQPKKTTLMIFTVTARLSNFKCFFHLGPRR